jgi:hypothetical protein
MIERICPNCGVANSSKTSLCINCGAQLLGAKKVEKKISPTLPQLNLNDEHLKYTEVYRRPSFVTLFAVIYSIRAFFGLVYILIYVPYVFLEAGYPVEVLISIFSYFLISIFILVLYLILAYGLLKGKKWVRFLVIILILIEILTIVITIASPTNVDAYPNIITLAINFIFLYLFMQGDVGHFFENYDKFYKKQ